jgi:hypothetical protein
MHIGGYRIPVAHKQKSLIPLVITNGGFTTY